MYKEYVIIGGGVAGLCAAIRLCELGANPLVIEAGNYPSHKVCGEFFSPESVNILKKWDIHPILIPEVHFHTSTETISYKFPSVAGSLSHIEFDPLLVQRASNATFLTNTKVLDLQPGKEIHRIELSSGEKIETPNLIIATGRLPNSTKPSPKIIYTGFKAHFETKEPINNLEMFLFDGAYAGISPIENGKFNVACLAKAHSLGESPSSYMNSLMAQNKKFGQYLSKGTCLFTEWMTASVPNFGVKNTQDWSNVYFIGDAAGTIPPATGNGLTLAIKSGIMAAEYAMDRKFKCYKLAWKKEFSKPIFWGKVLHQAFMSPLIASQVIKAGRMCPFLHDPIYHWTR